MNKTIINTIFEQANQQWNAAFNSQNLNGITDLYEESALLSPGNGQTLVGHVEIAGLFKQFLDAGVHNHTLEIVTCGGNENTIYQVAKWQANGAEDNGKVPTFGGITTSVMQKNQSGAWLTHSHVWNVAG
jgi:ketosteroid isomerase-like protein